MRLRNVPAFQKNPIAYGAFWFTVAFAVRLGFKVAEGEPLYDPVELAGMGAVTLVASGVMVHEYRMYLRKRDGT